MTSTQPPNATKLFHGISSDDAPWAVSTIATIAHVTLPLFRDADEIKEFGLQPVMATEEFGWSARSCLKARARLVFRQRGQ